MDPTLTVHMLGFHGVDSNFYSRANIVERNRFRLRFTFQLAEPGTRFYQKPVNELMDRNE